MTSLLTNISAMTALTTLKGINSQLDATSNRVSTGQRVSTASDNAAYWSIATAVRTDNSSLSAVKDSLGLGSSAVDTAYNGLNSSLTDLQNMRAKLQTAMQPGVDRTKVQTEINAIQNKMKATADSSVSSGQNWLSVDSTAGGIYKDTQNVVAGFSRDVSGNINFSMINVDVASIKLYDAPPTTQSSPATAAKVVSSAALTGTPDASADGTFNFAGAGPVTKQVSFTVSLGGTAKADIVLDKSTLVSAAKDLAKVTTSELLAAINNQLSADTDTKGKVTASLDDQGRLQFQTADTGNTKQVSIINNVVTDSAKFALADIGFGKFSGNLTAPTAFASNATYDISGGKSFDINGTTVTLDDAAFAKLGETATSADDNSVTGHDVVLMVNKQLETANNAARLAFDGTKFSVGSVSGISSTITVGNTGDEADLGFDGTDPATATFTTGVTGKGTNAGTAASNGLGILDKKDTGTGFSVATIDISTVDDDTLKKIITQVDKAIASVTNAGTKLGANKTQIDGQKSFVDTLMKANDRTIGTLVDADIEEESTKLKALQTQQQLAVQALSIANSSSQNVLSLFR
ncbi:flagellin N-terminal helical domain-containing protein [Methylorubrum extorquens]